MNNFVIPEILSANESSQEVIAWNLSSAYSFVSESNNLSKKSLERSLLSSGLLPKEVNQDLGSLTPILPIKNYWERLSKKKRFLSLKGSIHSYKGSKILFLQDKRKTRYWVPLRPSPAKKEWDLALEALSQIVNKSLIIWPNKELFEIFKNTIKSEEITLGNNKLFLPFGAYTDQIKNKKRKSNIKSVTMKNEKTISKSTLSHLEFIESESIHLIREIMAEALNPVMLYSMGKDSAVMLHLAKKAFLPSKIPFPILHVDTGWKFKEMYEYREWASAEHALDLIVYKNEEGINRGINPFDHGSNIHTEVMKTEALKQALDLYKFDFIFGGARRDEEKSRAKERVLSFRSKNHAWDPKNQKPELWNLYNCKKSADESARVFPLSNWTELDIWQYIYKENIKIVPLYFALTRPVVKRGDSYLMVDDHRFKMMKGEEIEMKKVRFRTLGCYPLTAAIESTARNTTEIILELIESNTTERSGRLIDRDEGSSMEQKKKEGYF